MSAGNDSAGLIKPLHGLRGAAAMTVLVGHLAPVQSTPSLGVVLFFLLSGFLIGRLYLQQRFQAATVFSYANARFARVYPLFAIVVLAAGAINAIAPNANLFELKAGDIARHLLLAGSGQTIWTICVEFQFYALFVGLWFIYARLGRNDLILYAAFIIAVFLAAATARTGDQVSILCYLHLFTAGLVLSHLLRDPSETARRFAGTVLPVFILLYIAAFFAVPFFYEQQNVYGDPVVCIICTATIYCAVAAPESWCGRLLSLPVMVVLGELSFGIYLLHRPSWWLVDVIAGQGGLRVSVHFICAAVLTLVLAQVANTLIENPARRRLRSLAMPLTARLAG